MCVSVYVEVYIIYFGLRYKTREKKGVMCHSPSINHGSFINNLIYFTVKDTKDTLCPKVVSKTRDFWIETSGIYTFS